MHCIRATLRPRPAEATVEIDLVFTRLRAVHTFYRLVGSLRTQMVFRPEYFSYGLSDLRFATVASSKMDGHCHWCLCSHDRRREFRYDDSPTSYAPWTRSHNGPMRRRTHADPRFVCRGGMGLAGLSRISAQKRRAEPS